MDIKKGIVKVLVSGGEGTPSEAGDLGGRGYYKANDLFVRETVIPLAQGVTPCIEITATNGETFYVVGEEANANSNHTD